MSTPLAALVAATTLVALPVSAADLAVFPVTVVNLSDSEAAAIGALFTHKMGDVTGASVLGPSRTSAALEGAQNPQAAASHLGVQQYVRVAAVRLEHKISLRAEIYAQDGTQQYRAEHTAMSLDDMEEVVERLAQSLHLREPVDATRNLRTITRREAEVPNRLFVERVWGFKTGFATPLAAGTALEPVLTGQYDLRLEGEEYFLEFGAGLILPTDTADQRRGYGGLFAEFGGSYYLTDDNIAPYVGGGVSPRIIISEHFDSGLSFAPFVQGGLMFMRQSSSRLYVDLRVAQNVIPLKTAQPWDWEEDAPQTQKKVKRRYPTEVALNVGIGW